MRDWKKKISFTMIVALAMLALLPLLAYLQYNWLGQVSQAERDRMQASLRAGIDHFSEDFDRELTRAFITFQLDNESQSDPGVNNFAQRYTRWLENSQHSHLIKAIYVVADGEQNSVKLSQYDANNNRFNDVDWPAELADVHTRCLAQREQQANPGLPMRQSFMPVDVKAPALLIPVAGLPLPGAGMPIEMFSIGNLPATGEHKFISRAEMDFNHVRIPVDRCSYTLLLLDRDYIAQEFFPALTQRYLSNGDKLDYNVMVVDGSDAHSAVYRSDAQLTNAGMVNADASQELMRLRFEEFDNLLFNRLPMKKIMINKDDAGAHKETRSQAGITILQTEHTHDNSKDIKVTHYFNFATSDNALHWQLLVKHRAGSLEAAVTSVRYHNLMLSFGILLLLGVTMFLILLSARRAQRLAKQQMEFVAGVSHELRTPLAVICAAGENLADGVISDRAQVKKYGELVKSEGRRLHDMVEQVLEFAGWQSNRKAYQLQPVSVAELMRGVITGCQPLIDEGGFNIELQLDNDLPTINGELTALVRAFQNLLNNAMKYSGESRWIGVRARVRAGAGEVEIIIADRGLGIPARELPHIFEPFYRGQEVMAAQIRGTGLGLSIVKQIITECRGRISVNSSEGQGSEFIVQLPIVSASAVAGAQKRAIAEGEYEQADFARGR